MKNSEEKWCVDSWRSKPVRYIGQKDPIIIGTFYEVKNWLDNFFKSIYKR
jgi:hypothetical protein